MFNSALVYELSALKPLVEPLLLQIEPGKPGHVEAKRLLAFLQWFAPMPIDLIPDNSILREFVGGSNLEVVGAAVVRGDAEKRELKKRRHIELSRSMCRRLGIAPIDPGSNTPQAGIGSTSSSGKTGR